MKAEESSRRSQDAIFPTPPQHAKDVSLSLRRQIELVVDGHSLKEVDDYVCLGGLGEGSSSTQDAPEVRVLDKEWIPSSNGRKGVWKQETQISSYFTLEGTPTFADTTLSLKVCAIFRIRSLFLIVDEYKLFPHPSPFLFMLIVPHDNQSKLRRRRERRGSHYTRRDRLWYGCTISSHRCQTQGNQETIYR